MNRRALGRLLWQGGGGVFLAGCEGLDLSAEGEGTGIQVVTALTILAKYRASQAQKAAADLAARRAFVALAMKPAMKRESRNLRLQVATPPPAAAPGAAAPPPAPAPGRVDEATFAAAWKRTAEEYQKSGEAAGPDLAMPVRGGSVAFAPLSSQSILTTSSAQAPNYLAVSVPPQGLPTESGAAEVVMLWNARRRQLAGDMVYAIKEQPREGRKVVIDGIPAVYVGRPPVAGL